MRIAVDGYELQKRFTGVGRYLDHLLSALLKLDVKNEYTLYLKEVPDRIPRADNLRTVVIPTGITHTRWQHTILSHRLNNENYDLFFSPDHSLPLLYKRRSFMTIHDVSWRALPRDYSLKERTVRDIKTRTSCRRAEVIFTDSRFSMDEIGRHYPAARGKLVPIHLGIDESFSPASAEAVGAFRRKYGLEGPVLGFLGSMFRRRRIAELMRAVETVRQEKPVTLFLVGKDFYNGELDDLLASDWIVRRERIEEEEINAFYSSLDLFVYPSDYEGFGFPPLEALHCGTVPVVSRSSSLGEVCDSMAVFFENHTPGHMAAVLADAIERLEEIRAELLRVFDRRRPRFSWKQVAGRYLEYFTD